MDAAEQGGPRQRSGTLGERNTIRVLGKTGAIPARQLALLDAKVAQRAGDR